MNLTTEAQLADQFGIAVEKVADLRRRHRWPHVRLGRFDIRYTDEQVADIVRLHTEKVATPATPDLKVSGQTARSASSKRAS